MDGAEFQHVSVMPRETVEGLLSTTAGVYVDCTLGGAGHSLRIASRLSADGWLIGIDRDAAAVAAARERLKDVSCRISIVHDNFRNLDAILGELGADAVDGVLFDLGVSSYQIDTAERGFSYMHDAPLDMRMDERQKLTAYDIVNSYSEDELERIFREYGEERWGKRIAAFIAEMRKEAPVKTTAELVDIVCRAVPKAVRREAGGHPAKRVFQAVRIEANDELSILESSIRAAVRHLRPGGRIAILTFHSLEDRIAKNTLREMARGCICPPGLPVCVCGHRPEVRLLGKARKPGADEMKGNPRAKSAKLRLAEKTTGAK
ncbi:MAG: 16S rRNA (cytosine(1402)-N(4))-methyltransferase RsmH [Schwartzia sp.]|nr:16S rRNA (cytosine(1402)-N(4))-methyltransferase RsmH [Schwartzia sp. (in: firmicutes)]